MIETKPKNFKEILSQPWIGPSISLVVLAVSLSALAIAVASYVRQGDRWEAEDASSVQLQLAIQVGLTRDGFRPVLVLFSGGREPMRLQSLSVILPRDSTMSPAKNYIVLTKPAGSIVLDPSLGISAEPQVQVELLMKTPGTPLQDQGTVVEIEGTAVELAGSRRTITRRAKAIVPTDAVKSPSL
jgi:hypothetical protein